VSGTKPTLAPRTSTTVDLRIRMFELRIEVADA
jgi:hypothetical protein